jgi:hypothetical protein
MKSIREIESEINVTESRLVDLRKLRDIARGILRSQNVCAIKGRPRHTDRAA